jgi:hypothetical protein
MSVEMVVFLVEFCNRMQDAPKAETEIEKAIYLYLIINDLESHLLSLIVAIVLQYYCTMEVGITSPDQIARRFFSGALSAEWQMSGDLHCTR